MDLMYAAFLCSLFAATLYAQPIYVYSEFVTINAQGKVTSQGRPREILSPAIPRNAYSSFQVVVETGPDKTWWMHVGQNPENAVDVTMYRVKDGSLEKADLPLKGQGTQVLWMDVWAARNAQTGRIKVEPQLNIDDDWIIYPMEVRVSDPVVAGGSFPVAAETPLDAMKRFLCGGPAPRSAATAPKNVAEMRNRNAQQDLALAAKESKPELLKKFGACASPTPANPEAYYPIRDFLVKHALH